MFKFIAFMVFVCGCNDAVSQQSSVPIAPVIERTQDCEPSYPDVCIPFASRDLDCRDIPYRNFKVLPPDPHNFDGDMDGIGCEFYLR